MTRCVAWVGRWDTAKTDTTEIIIGTEFGIASFKVVVSANGKKTSVYSGFQSATWSWQSAHGRPSLMQKTFWDHKYVSAMHKACEKWDAPTPECLEVLTVKAALRELPDHAFDALMEAIGFGPADLTVDSTRDHYEMLLRSELTPPALTLKPEIVKTTVSRYEEDELFGVF